MNYTKSNVRMGKAAAKEALQAETGLDIDPSKPLFGYIGRLEEQKGVDILMEVRRIPYRRLPAQGPAVYASRQRGHGSSVNSVFLINYSAALVRVLQPCLLYVHHVGTPDCRDSVYFRMQALPKVLQSTKAQVVILGTGKASFEKKVDQLQGTNPNLAGVVKFSAPLAHQITAGADFLMVPSRFEPCGLIQLHAMQYGTIPVVASPVGLWTR